MIHLPDLSFFSAMLAGLLSSTHCIAMCGALALAGHAPAAGQSHGPDQVLSLTAYHAGRLFSYALVGALAGASGGWLLTQACSEEVLALWPRVVANLALIGIALAMLLGWRGLERSARPFLPLWRRIMPVTARLRRLPGPGARFTLGMLWGWIPCGLIYAVAATAAISGSANTGASLLLGFGIGTLPALLGGSLLMGNGLARIAGNTAVRPLLAMGILTVSLWQLTAAASQL